MCYVSLVPKLHLGTHLSAKLCFTQAGATKLRRHLRYQVQLENEELKMNRLWPTINFAAILYFFFSSLFWSRSEDMEAFATVLQQDAGKIFLIVAVPFAFLSAILFVLVFFTACKTGSANEYFSKPSWDRGPIPVLLPPSRFIDDPLQLLRISWVMGMVICLGLADGVLFLNAPFTPFFYLILAMTLGNFVGERLVYRLYRDNIIESKPSLPAL